jgi:hypothetical protein
MAWKWEEEMKLAGEACVWNDCCGSSRGCVKWLRRNEAMVAMTAVSAPPCVKKYKLRKRRNMKKKMKWKYIEEKRRNKQAMWKYRIVKLKNEKYRSYRPLSQPATVNERKRGVWKKTVAEESWPQSDMCRRRLAVWAEMASLLCCQC